MTRTAKLICLLLALLLMVGCTGPAAAEPTVPDSDQPTASVTLPEQQTAAGTEQALAEIRSLGESPDDNYRVWYEIFVYSFCDSDGDGIGDLQGVISRLDYLEELGITGIWLMPIHPSTTYHKYNVSDYYAIDPDYGTMADFEQLIEQCNARGIRVILDLVVNHSGSEHLWFRTAAEYLRSLGEGEAPDPSVCPYVDYYNFVQAESAPAGYSVLAGTENWFYESRFSYDMPDLNLASEPLRDEIRSIMEFWLEKGVSGFRLDAAKEFYSGNAQKNIEVLSWIQQTAVSLRPDCYLVAEVWDSFSTIAAYYESGITSIFNYAFGGSSGKTVSVLQGVGNPTTAAGYAAALEKADSTYRANHADYIDAPFLSNHDVGRIAGFVGRSAEKTKLAGAMNLLMSGSAFIYYGEEIGMVAGGADDPSYRAPMYWNEERTDGTTASPPGCTLPGEYPFGSLEQQRNEDSSVYNYYRQAIAIRRALPVISHGTVTVEAALNVGCVSAQRKTWNGESCVILINFSKDTAQVDLSGYEDWYLATSLTVDEAPVTVDGAALTLPAFGVAVLLPEN